MNNEHRIGGSCEKGMRESILHNFFFLSVVCLNVRIYVENCKGSKIKKKLFIKTC